MTIVSGVGFAIVYEFCNGETALVRVSEMLGPMRSVIEYLSARNGGIRRIIEPARPATEEGRRASIKDRLALLDAARKLEHETRRQTQRMSEAA